MELCRLRPCGPRHSWKTRKAPENWRHLSRSDLRNHVWVTRGYFCLLGKLASSAPLSFHQIRCIEIQVPKPTSSKCKYTSLKVAADGVWSGLVASHWLSDRCKQQSLRSECHTLWIPLSQLWIPLSLQKGCRAPFGQTKQAPMISHLYQFYFKHCLFCFLVCLSKCVWLVIFFLFSSFRSVECRQILWHTAEGV